MYEWTVTLDLDHQGVRQLLYDHGTGFILVGFAGDTLLTRTWVE